MSDAQKREAARNSRAHSSYAVSNLRSFSTLRAAAWIEVREAP